MPHISPDVRSRVSPRPKKRKEKEKKTVNRSSLDRICVLGACGGFARILSAEFMRTLVLKVPSAPAHTDRIKFLF